MLSVWLIRHAESEANAGMKTSDPKSTSLTEKGWEQAQIFAQSLTEAPALMITSPYQRAKQTAAPTLARFPDVPTQVWSIQEFTYLCPTLYQNTT